MHVLMIFGDETALLLRRLCHAFHQPNCQPDLKSSAPLFDADDFKLADNLADEKRDRDRQKCPSMSEYPSAKIISRRVSRLFENHYNQKCHRV